MTESSATQMVGVGTPTLRQLRSAILGSADSAAAVAALRESGYAGGGAVFAAFEQWLTESGAEESDLRDMTLDRFGERTTQFFRDAGWGEVTFSPDEMEDVAIVDIDDCWEASGPPSAGPQGAQNPANGHGCHITTGLLAAFFGRIAGYPVAVLEVECGGVDAARCRFLLGNAEVMNHRWEEMR